MQTLTAENLADNRSDQSGSRRPSLLSKEGSQGPINTSLSMRRMSSLEGRLNNHSSRMSMVSRSSVTGSSVGIKNIGLYTVKLQNTYKLQPDPSEMFKPGSVSDVMQEVLIECLDGEKYNPTQCRTLSQMLTDLIKSRVKDMGFQRYKYIVTVTIGQNSNQGVRVVSRCLWNNDTDNYAEASYNKNGLYAVAAVYACYFE
ncbi:dynein light chain Tctex-type protein 2B-like [Dreissena polymorpha]|uniref:Uncharacterized protein n=1 Tax=Dreissena polymorpha TaxID=45954 RepID=A0A9D4K752_DREPO|nr:dynein light chain Tctex-type protein 2B-like [Dreissena polymorpha]KAH3834261.1 hypothetical protein DPMN_107581 [Dreissena polymorpha]